ncbi:TRAP transporter substrate-binding protein [Salipiger sp. P9]|uniref:TRAP transporter substrate-binding protein n=1 Tax=Salipiger pentaromativorans TaxID=2943193 RepID=UPI00215842B7|nr:TRAP transporter substrate-binding protein [Salipiger pentaromativorans]MCR8548849.1 TRAP transporter substrate-binding protein [Salipiger pentaromativorans]
MTTRRATRRSFLKTGLLGLSATLALPSLARAADTLVLNYNQWFPSGHWSQADGLYKWFEKISEVTDGRVTLQASAKPLAPPNRNYQAVVDGVADIAWGPHGYTPGVFPLTEMVELPFITHDAGVSSRAYWRLWKEYFEPTGMQADVVTLAMHVTAGGNISMRKAPVTSMAGLRGKKLRVPTPVVGRVLQEQGVVPVSGSLTELREMLSRGIVDGTVISDELVTGFKVDEDIHGVTQVPGGIFSNSAFVIMNKGKWDRIAPEDQAAIMAISGEGLSETMGGLWQSNDLAARESFKARLGENYTVADEAFMGEIETAFSGELDKWKAAATEAGIDAEGAVGFYNAQIAELGQ